MKKLVLLIFPLCFILMAWVKNLTGDVEPEIEDRIELLSQQVQAIFDELEDIKFRIRILEKENL